MVAVFLIWACDKAASFSNQFTGAAAQRNPDPKVRAARTLTLAEPGATAHQQPMLKQYASPPTLREHYLEVKLVRAGRRRQPTTVTGTACSLCSQVIGAIPDCTANRYVLVGSDHAFQRILQSCMRDVKL